MTATLRRQIHRAFNDLESIKPKPTPCVHYRLMAAPGDDATAEERAAHQAELEAAHAAGFKVIRLVGIKPEVQISVQKTESASAISWGARRAAIADPLP